MNDIEFDMQNRETRAQRSQRMRRLRRWRQGMVTLSGLTALSLTLQLGSNLIQPTYSIFTSKAGLSGGFTAKESFCGKDDEEDERRRDLTVSDALYKDLTASQDKGGKGGDKGGDKGDCKDGKEHEDDKHMIPDATLPTPPEETPKPSDQRNPDQPNPPASGTDQPSQGKGKPDQGNGQPGQGNGKPSQDNGKPSQDNGKPSQDNGKPSQDNGQPSQGNGHPSRDNGKPGQGNDQPAQRNDQTAQLQQKDDFRIPPQRSDNPMDESRPESEYGVYRGPMSSPSDVPPR